jgi:hypothetical protein
VTRLWEKGWPAAPTIARGHGGPLKGVAVNLSKVKLGAICVAMIAAVALIAGCGGSGNTPASPAAAKAAIKKAISAATAKTGATSTPTTADVSKTGSVSKFADASRCAQLGGVDTKFAQAMAAASSGGKLNYQAAVKDYQQLADAAPSAIRPDLEAIAQSFTSFANAIAKSGYKPGKAPSPTQILALGSAVKSFSSSKLATAEKDLEAWAAKNCA